MSTAQYNPEIHHRQSIRLKGHDYAGGGLYFVTICAHREFIAFANGHPFTPPVGARPASPSLRATQVSPAEEVAGEERATQVSPAEEVAGEERATQVSPVRALIEERMRITAKKCPFMKWEEAVIMPDHFHALIRMEGGHQRLGDVVGGFKAAVTREIRRGDTCVAPYSPHIIPPKNTRIWHRNYYEAIVRTPEASERIAEYIRMNPWRCVTELGNGLRGMGNPALWNQPKLGLLCSRHAPPPKTIPHAAAYLGGFHSPMEKEIFSRLMELRKPLIWCPAWGLDRAAFAPGVREALEQNRMLILEMHNRDGNLAAAERRNRFVIEMADTLWTPHVTPGGMLERLLRENKRVESETTERKDVQ